MHLTTFCDLFSPFLKSCTLETAPFEPLAFIQPNEALRCKEFSIKIFKLEVKNVFIARKIKKFYYVRENLMKSLILANLMRLSTFFSL